jgi:hypothetical protein
MLRGGGEYFSASMEPCPPTSCPVNTPCTEATLRHDALHGVLAKYLTAAGMSLKLMKEVRRLDAADQRRPDLLVLDGSLHRFITDDTIVDPLCWSQPPVACPFRVGHHHPERIMNAPHHP